MVEIKDLFNNESAEFTEENKNNLDQNFGLLFTMINTINDARLTNGEKLLDKILENADLNADLKNDIFKTEFKEIYERLQLFEMGAYKPYSGVMSNSQIKQVIQNKVDNEEPIKVDNVTRTLDSSAVSYKNTKALQKSYRVWSFLI